ncbi:hypothetical protein [Desulforhopalus singaporensis]|uniref:Uncharacterized protein n=1 Tax=Desulforhopalus singaporensis TaxID=91360 RepID=A0A1H0IVN6_9BACT|nr:hypothetical protein [Desulforhopalus singaporensis]SDO35485.1 hypothetical protein SAMN05660330_00043 [Desulforhopalus singaporensis]
MNFGDEEVFYRLENKIIKNNAGLEDIISFQKLIDDRVHKIFILSLENLFAVEPVQCARQQPQESTSIYMICSTCGQQVLATRCIERRDVFTTPCNDDSIGHNINC